MDNIEVPVRDVQREMVFQQIKNPVSRELLRSSIPSNEKRQYNLSTDMGHELGRNLIQLLKNESGDAYKYIFALATTAQNPNELFNALGSLSVIQHWGFARSDDDKVLIDQSQNAFLRSAKTTPFASDEARALQAQMIGIWSQYEKDESLVANVIKSTYEGYGKEEAVRNWTEAYLLTIIDPQTPRGLRKILLSKPLTFGLGQDTWRDDRRFTESASIWKSASAEWLFPEIFGKTSSGDVKDWEIAGLRKTVDELKRQVQEPQPRGNLEQERARLQALSAQLLQAITESEAKVQLYKSIGQHPLDALGIGYNTWRITPFIGREELLKSKYRELAKKYHYQIPQSDPRFDPLTQELANERFTRLENARVYLLKNLQKNEF